MKHPFYGLTQGTGVNHLYLHIDLDPRIGARRGKARLPDVYTLNGPSLVPQPSQYEKRAKPDIRMPCREIVPRHVRLRNRNKDGTCTILPNTPNPKTCILFGRKL